jgi:4-hydroxy-3-methylbut-2-enyl diphosphate reductase IspH
LLVWSFVIFINIFVRVVLPRIKSRAEPLTSEFQTLGEAGFKHPEVFVYNGKAYWLDDGALYGANHMDVVDLNSTERVNPLEQTGLTLDEYMYVLTTLETRKKELEKESL